MFILGGCVTDGMIIRAIARYFTKSSPVVLPDDYDEIRSRVTGWVDQPYGNPKKNEILDVYRPKNTEEKLPLILWVHGGAFITGSKEETVPYMVMLADRGFVTATINYQVAPDDHVYLSSQFDSRLKLVMRRPILVSNQTKLGGKTSHDRLKCYQRAGEKATVVYH
jgi:hypothetical protein